MSLGLNDTMKFGKYVGKAIHFIVLDDVSYLAWLREQKRSMQPRFFDATVNSVIDAAIKADPVLKRKYKPWDVTAAPIEDIIKAQVETIAVNEDADNRRKAAYSGTWGEW